MLRQITSLCSPTLSIRNELYKYSGVKYIYLDGEPHFHWDTHTLTTSPANSLTAPWVFHVDTPLPPSTGGILSARLLCLAESARTLSSIREQATQRTEERMGTPRALRCRGARAYISMFRVERPTTADERRSEDGKTRRTKAENEVCEAVSMQQMD